jgi:hypothetical protein
MWDPIRKIKQKGLGMAPASQAQNSEDKP